MASTSSTAAFSVANVGASGTAHKSVQEQFERLPGESAPIVASLGYGPAVGLDEGFKIQKIVDRDMPQTVTTTVALTTGDLSITLSTTDAALLQDNQVLMIDDELILVTAPHATTPTISRAFAGSTATGHVDTSTAYILSPAFLDTDSFAESAKMRGEMKSFYPQQIMYSWSETAMRTAVTSYLTRGEDEMAFERKNKMREVVKALGRSCWYNLGIAPTSTVQGSFAGIRSLVDTNKNTSVGVLTATHLVDLADDIIAWDDSVKSFEVYGNANMKRIWDAVMNAYFDRRGEPNTTKVGVRVDSFATSIADFHYTVDRQLLDGELYFLKKGDIKLHPIAVKGGFSPGWQFVERGPEETNALTRQVGYYNLLTLLIGDERRHGRLAGITTTTSSYSGYV